MIAQQGTSALLIAQDPFFHFRYRALCGSIARASMSVDRIEADIAAVDGPSLGTATEPETPNFDIRFTLETGYTPLDRVEFSGSTSNAAS